MLLRLFAVVKDSQGADLRSQTAAKIILHYKMYKLENLHSQWDWY